MSAIDENRVHPVLSYRDRFDLATLLAAGVASTAFMLLPVWTSFDRPTVPTVRNVQAPAANAQALVLADRPPAPTPARSVRAPRPAPRLARARTQARAPQSRLSRLLLGDGSERVQPFPVAATGPER